MPVTQTALFGIPGKGESGAGAVTGVPCHGHYTGTNANALAASTDNPIVLYEPGSTVAITLGTSDRMVITDMNAAVGATMAVSLLNGGTTAYTPGEVIGIYRCTANIAFQASLATPHFCKPGFPPRVITSTSGQVDVIIHGYVERR